tara:strand:- start:1656 stop:2036 length:381 start_codon:yes stop_codon:yes gene_type:complete
MVYRNCDVRRRVVANNARGVSVRHQSPGASTIYLAPLPYRRPHRSMPHTLARMDEYKWRCGVVRKSALAAKACDRTLAPPMVVEHALPHLGAWVGISDARLTACAALLDASCHQPDAVARCASSMP